MLVQDNLNTHSPASLYATFEPAKARRIAERFEWNYTPRHGSWLNMAEAELSVLSQQCLKEHIGSKVHLARDVTLDHAKSPDRVADVPSYDKVT